MQHIRCCKTDLVRHSQTVKHIKKVNSNINCNATDNIKNTLSHKNKVKRVEIKLAAFFAEHNVVPPERTRG